ncbi:MAG: hypothetical protein IPK33_17075 [Gemmatimonadetes bacterium]|nr:hypothetical protein [Gemmatimonadota bacterium]
MWRETWNTWRRPLLAAAVLLIVGGMAAQYLRREGRHLVVKPNMLVLASRDLGGTFFRDSTYLVRLGAHEGTAIPIRIRVWYAGAGMTMLVGERELRRAIEQAVADRRHATAEVVVGGAMMRSPAPGVDVSLKLWGEGGFSSSVSVRCALGDGPPEAGAVVNVEMSENDGIASASWALDALLRKILDDAAQARCPVMRGRGLVRAPAREPLPVTALSAASSVAAVSAAPSAPPSASVVTSPLPSVGPPPQAVRDSAALAYVGDVNAPVMQLAMARDTMHLRVGEAQVPEQVLNLTGRRANGSIVERFVPLYIVEDPRVAAMGAGGMRGIAPGTTWVVVRVMGTKLSTVRTDGASAHFVVKVEP